MELIERYIYAVTRHLPLNQRQDVADELRGTIEDTLDEKGTRLKKNIESILLELGDPDTLAEKYIGVKHYIIGPTFYSAYIRIMKYAFAIGLPTTFIVNLIIGLTDTTPTLISLLLTAFGNTAAAAIQIVFWISLTFFILERSGIDAKELADKKGLWNPSMLPQLPVQRQIPLSEVITDFFTYAFIIALPFLAQSFFALRTGTQNIPIFNPEIWAVGTGITIGFGIIGCLIALIKLSKHAWNKPLAIFNLLFAVSFSIFLVASYLSITIANPELLTYIQQHSANSDLGEIIAWTQWIVGASIAATVTIWIFEATKPVIAVFRKKNKD